MWIIPKTSPIYRSAQATEALTSDYEELSKRLEQSVMWRSEHFQSTTWLRRLKRGSWMSVLFSQTLKLSHGNTLIEEWISCQEASLVSLSPAPESKQEIKTLDTCGPISQMVSRDWGDLPLFSSRMSSEYLAPTSQALIGTTTKAPLFCSISIERWNDWVIAQRQESSARTKLAHHTYEKESLFLVSGLTSQGKVGITSVLCSVMEQNRGEVTWVATKPITAPPQAEVLGLPQEEQDNTHGSPAELLAKGLNWPTPVARDYKGQTTRGGTLPDSLLGVYIPKKDRWITPTANDYISRTVDQIKRRQEKGKQITPRCQHVLLKNSDARKAVNPRWVETLMGLPIGWVQPTCTTPVIAQQMSCVCSATGSSPHAQSMPSATCSNDYVWPTPTTRGWDEKISVWVRRCLNRLMRGDRRFAMPLCIHLKLTVEQSTLLSKLLEDVDVDGDTDEEMKRIMETALPLQ